MQDRALPKRLAQQNCEVIVSTEIDVGLTSNLIFARYVFDIFGEYNSKAPVAKSRRVETYHVTCTYAFKCQSIWLNFNASAYNINISGKTCQCKNHGPGLSVTKRIVTLSTPTPVLSPPIATTSRRTGLA